LVPAGSAALQAQRDADAAAAGGNDQANDAGNDDPGGPSAPPDQNAQ
jgi:electron transport complex protein RnfB